MTEEGWDGAGMTGAGAEAAYDVAGPIPLSAGRIEQIVDDAVGRGGGGRGVMTELERWLADTFYREGSDLIVGPIVWRVALCREDVDVLIRGLIEARDILPALEQRLQGLSTCEACDGSQVVHGVDRDLSDDCPACAGEGFAPRKGETI